MSTSWKEIAELVGIAAIIASLVFVGLELRQNTISTRAAAYQSLGINVTETWQQLADNSDLNDSFWKWVEGGAEALEAMSDTEKRQLRSWTLATFRAYETAYWQVEEGLLDREALKSLGWGRFDAERTLEQMPELRPFLDGSFVAFIEENGGT